MDIQRSVFCHNHPCHLLPRLDQPNVYHQGIHSSALLKSSSLLLPCGYILNGNIQRRRPNLALQDVQESPFGF